MREPKWIGGTNPIDEQPEEREPEEFIMGKYMTKDQLIETLNTGSRVAFAIDDHDDDTLYIRVKFEQK